MLDLCPYCRAPISPEQRERIDGLAEEGMGTEIEDPFLRWLAQSWRRVCGWLTW